MSNTHLLAIWGGTASGKTAATVKLALELAAHKKNVAIVMCDSLAPAPQTLLPNSSTEGKSLGELLTLPTISQEAILNHCIPFYSDPYISLLGYMRGDNAFTYASYSKERAVDLLTLLRHVADYVLVDVSSMFSSDVLSTVALENADTVLRLCTCDLKSMSYFSSNLPLLADGRFAASQHIRVLSMVKPGQDSGEYSNAYGGVSYTLPYVPELEEQFYSATLPDKLFSIAGREYTNIIRKIAARISVTDRITDDMNQNTPSLMPSSSGDSSTVASIREKKQKPVKESKERRFHNLKPQLKKDKQSDSGGGLFERLKKGDKS